LHNARQTLFRHCCSYEQGDLGFLRLLTLARVGGEEHLGLAGHEGQLGDDAGAAGGELYAEQGALGSFPRNCSLCITALSHVLLLKNGTFRDIFRLNLPQKTKARCH
jgi:hypothetical protein